MNKLLQFAFILISTNLHAGTTPQWVADPTGVDGCLTFNICVIGSGTTLVSAMAQGRVELAKYFETKVKVNSSITTSMNSSEGKIFVDPGRYDEWMSKTISEEADELLSGVEVKRTENIDNTFYVLSSLSKNLVSKQFKEKLEAIDKENEVLYSKNSRFVYPQIFFNLKKRSFYSSRYQLVSSTPIQSRITEAQMLADLKRMNPMKMSLINQDKVKLPVSINFVIEQLFSPLKVIFVPKSENPQYFLKSKMIFGEEYLKVSGFKKFNIVLKLELRDDHQKILGRVSASSIQVARNQNQGLEMAVEDIEKQLREKLDQIKLD